MKFIKYAVGLVIALSVIPMVVVAVTKLDEPRLKSVEFEVIDYENGVITFSDNTYNNIHALTIVDNAELGGYYVTNLITTKVNDIEFTDFGLFSNTGEYNFVDGLDDVYSWDELYELNQANTAGYQATIGDKWEMTFEVPSSTPPLVKLLVGFAPLLFVGGILLFMLNKRKLS